VPTIVLDAENDGVEPISRTGKDAHQFISDYERRVVKGVGHNLPQESPNEFANAILSFLHE